MITFMPVCHCNTQFIVSRKYQTIHECVCSASANGCDEARSDEARGFCNRFHTVYFTISEGVYRDTRGNTRRDTQEWKIIRFSGVHYRETFVFIMSRYQPISNDTSYNYSFLWFVFVSQRRRRSSIDFPVTTSPLPKGSRSDSLATSPESRTRKSRGIDDHWRLATGRATLKVSI